MKIISFVLLTAMTYSSCTSFHMIKENRLDYEKMNEDLEGYKVRILKKNKEVILAENVSVMPDSTFWLDPFRRRVFTSTSEINELTVKSTWRGAKDGLYYGFLAGTGFGIVVALLVEKKSGGLDTKAFAPMIGIGAGIGTSVWGMIIGATIGHTDRYMIEATKDSTSLNSY